MTSAAVIERRKAKAVKLNNDLKTFVEQYDTEDDWKTYLDIISHFRQLLRPQHYVNTQPVPERLTCRWLP